jgi:hypothetical protein
MRKHLLLVVAIVSAVAATIIAQQARRPESSPKKPIIVQHISPAHSAPASANELLRHDTS